MLTFRNTLFHLHRRIGVGHSAYEDGTVCFETPAYKIQTPGNHPEESIQHSEHGESLKSRSLFLRGFVLTRLENLQHVSKIRDSFRFNAIWHTRSLIARSVGYQHTVTSLFHQSRVWFDYVNGTITLVSFSTVLAFLINVTEKSTSPSVIQVKNRRKTISVEKKLAAIRQLKKKR
jgi:hypothetical protein